jgi:phosphonate transport system substrate-binding protein
MKGLTILFVALLFSSLAPAYFPVWSTGSAQDILYNFGVVPQFEQRKLFKIWRPILDELEQQTQLGFKLVGSPKIPVFEQMYFEGDYDFAYMNPYHMLKANDSQGYLPLVRDGSRKLKGILVVSKDSPVQNIQGIAGKRIAFPAPNALGASLLMRAELAQLHGISIIPHYVKTHSSVYLHVILGLTSAGGGITTTLNAQKPELREKLRVIYETRSINPHPISVHPRVPLAHRKRVRQALLEMAETEKGASLLAKIPIRKMVTATMADYSPINSWGLERFYAPENHPEAKDVD